MMIKNTIYPEFNKQVAEWFCATDFQPILLCIHEGTHLFFARECGYEPQVYGPSDESFYRKGVGWRRLLGSVDCPPPEILLTADILSIGKFHFGPAYIEERMFGEDRWKEVWDRATGDFENYHNWRRNYWRRIDRDVSPANNRKAVYSDFDRAEFRERLMSAAREYETRVFGTQIN